MVTLKKEVDKACQLSKLVIMRWLSEWCFTKDTLKGSLHKNVPFPQNRGKKSEAWV